MPKKLNIDERFARMCQQEFTDLHKENVSVRAEVGELRKDVAGGFAAVDNQLTALVQVLRDMRTDFTAASREDAGRDRELVQLRGRVERLEKKVRLRK